VTRWKVPRSGLTSVEPTSPLEIFLVDYQEELWAFLDDRVRDGCREMGVDVPVGGGKTVACCAFLGDHLSREHREFDRVVVLVPSTSIQEGWNANYEIKFRANTCGGGPPILYENLTTCPGTDRVEAIRNHIAPRTAGETAALPVLVTTYQAFYKCLQDHGFPEDMSRICVMSDEAHRVPKADDEGWKRTRHVACEANAIWITITATGWREDTGEPVHGDEEATFRVPVSRVIAAGRCPRFLEVHVHPLIASLRWKEATGEEDSEGGLELADYAEIVQWWLDDGRPRTVIRTQSTEVADRIVAIFEKFAPEARVLNATGDARRRVDEMVSREAKARTDGGKGPLDISLSQYDVVVCCQRFTEGTDWPFASHVYIVGIPSTLRFTVQVTGRGRRAKINIVGYATVYPDFVDRSVVRVFVPRVSDADDDLEAKRTFLRDLCVLYSVMTEDYEVARNLVDLYAVTRSKIGDGSLFLRAGANAVVATIFEPPADVLVDVFKRIRHIREALRRRLERDPSVGEMIDALSRQKDVSALDKVRDLVTYLRDSDVAAAIPEDRREGIRRAVEALVGQVVSDLRREHRGTRRRGSRTRTRPPIPAQETIQAFRNLAGEFDDIACRFGSREDHFRSELEAATSVRIVERARELAADPPHFHDGTNAYEQWIHQFPGQPETRGDLSPYLGRPPGTYSARRFRRDLEARRLPGQPEEIADIRSLREYIG